MKCDRCGGEYQEKLVTYTIMFEGKFHIIEGVPAKECPKCGDRLYAPPIVEKIQTAIWSHKKPSRVVETPVIEFASI